jgi:uncharacterized protein
MISLYDMKNKILILICIIQVGLIHLSRAQQTGLPVIKDVFFQAESAKLGGFVGERLDASTQNRILAQDVDKLIEPFQNRTEDRCWQSEFWGKWFTSAVLAYRYSPSEKLKIKLDKAIVALLATQTSDGYIGNYRDDKHLEQWDIWGRKYCLLGLLSYYDLTKDINVLKASSKIADHLMKELADRKVKIVTTGNFRGMAASSILEPICLLYARTNDPRYLEFAKEIVSEWESAKGPQLITKSNTDVSQRFPKPKGWFSWEQGQKAYEMMSCYEGLLELYRLTGETSYLNAVKATWQNIKETEINITGSGSSVECWFRGKNLQTMAIDHYQETCVTATWIKLNQQLLRLTGESKYADAIEQTYYNALLGAMYTDGSDWAKYSPLAGQRQRGNEQCNMGLNCCVASGPRGLFTYPLTAVMGTSEGLALNFFNEGRSFIQTQNGERIEVITNTDYPVSGKISFRIIGATNKPIKVKIRIPAWSTQSSITINQEQGGKIVAGSYAELSRIWKSTDLVILNLDMRGRLVHLGDHPENLAIQRGPIVLARDARLGSPAVDQTIKPITDKEGYLNLEATSALGVWMAFKGNFKIESHLEKGSSPVPINFCDYASAGNTLNEKSWFRVWLPQSYNPTN